MVSLVPLKFAQALADVAVELKQEDQVLEELSSFSALLGYSCRDPLLLGSGMYSGGP